MGLIVNCKKTMLLAVLLNLDAQPIPSILIYAKSDFSEEGPSFQYFERDIPWTAKSNI